MGPPLTESPEQYRRTSGFTHGAHGGRTTCAAQCACSNDGGEQGRHRVPAVEPNARYALKERPTGNCRQGLALHYGWSGFEHGLGDHANPTQGRG